MSYFPIIAMSSPVFRDRLMEYSPYKWLRQQLRPRGHRMSFNYHQCSIQRTVAWLSSDTAQEPPDKTNTLGPLYSFRKWNVNCQASPIHVVLAQIGNMLKGNPSHQIKGLGVWIQRIDAGIDNSSVRNNLTRLLAYDIKWSDALSRKSKSLVQASSDYGVSTKAPRYEPSSEVCLLGFARLRRNTKTVHCLVHTRHHI